MIRLDVLVLWIWMIIGSSLGRWMPIPQTMQKRNVKCSKRLVQEQVLSRLRQNLRDLGLVVVIILYIGDSAFPTTKTRRITASVERERLFLLSKTAQILCLEMPRRLITNRLSYNNRNIICRRSKTIKASTQAKRNWKNPSCLILVLWWLNW